MEELTEMQKDIESKMDELKGVNGVYIMWCSPCLHCFVGSEFYDDFMSAVKFDPETQLVHSTPVTMVWLIFY